MKNVLTALLIFTTSLAAAAPNVLILTADDMNWDSLGCTGSVVADTSPNLDRLAAEGIRFSHAHVASTACMPSRNAINHGRLPHRAGAGGFEHLRVPNLPTIPHTLTAHGYRAGIIGKVHHSTPYEGTPWDPECNEDIGRNTEEFYTRAKAFMASCKKAKKPFYLIVNSHDPHRPYYNIDSWGKEVRSRKGKPPNSHPSKVFDPGTIVLPGFVPDHPDVRHELACYYSSVRRCDDVMGRVLDGLKELNLDEDTVVIFLSDHGMAMPAAKSNAYMNSTRTPFIVRWPGKIQAGQIDDTHFVSSLDIFPTLLELADINGIQGLDGRSIWSLTQGKKQADREAIHTQFYRTIGKSNLQMRTYQNTEFSYTFNAWHNGNPAYSSSSMGGSVFKTMLALGKTDAQWAERANYLLVRAPEEFYNLKKDPNCLNNLINSPEYTQKIATFRTATGRWLKQTQDYVLPPFEVYQQTTSVEKMHEAFVATLEEHDIPGKAPLKVNMDRWSDEPSTKKRK